MFRAPSVHLASHNRFHAVPSLRTLSQVRADFGSAWFLGIPPEPLVRVQSGAHNDAGHSLIGEAVHHPRI